MSNHSNLPRNPFRRALIAASLAGAVLPHAREGQAMTASSATVRELTLGDFESSRRWAPTRFGRIAYWERGAGPAAIFLHGFPLNGFHWRGALARLSDVRRCIAPDLMGLGHTEPAPGQDLTFTDQAAMILAFMDEIGVAQADFVANDSGCAVLQILAVRAPGRVKSLVLTNGDTHDNVPPEAFRASHEFAKQGQLAERLKLALANPALARSPAAFGRTHQHPERLTDEILSAYLAPILATPERCAAVNRYVATMDKAATVAIHDDLKRLKIPALVVWGDADVFFDVRWAHWLDETLPNSRLHILPGAKLFFAEERAHELCALIRPFWS